MKKRTLIIKQINNRIVRYENNYGNPVYINEVESGSNNNPIVIQDDNETKQINNNNNNLGSSSCSSNENKRKKKHNMKNKKKKKQKTKSKNQKYQSNSGTLFKNIYHNTINYELKSLKNNTYNMIQTTSNQSIQSYNKSIRINKIKKNHSTFKKEQYYKNLSKKIQNQINELSNDQNNTRSLKLQLKPNQEQKDHLQTKMNNLNIIHNYTINLISNQIDQENSLMELNVLRDLVKQYNRNLNNDLSTHLVVSYVEYIYSSIKGANNSGNLTNSSLLNMKNDNNLLILNKQSGRYPIATMNSDESINIKGTLGLENIPTSKQINDVKKLLNSDNIMKRIIIKKKRYNFYMFITYNYQVNKENKRLKLQQLRSAKNNIEKKNKPFLNSTLFQKKNQAVCSIDPGGIIPWTIYDHNENQIINMFPNEINYFKKMNHYIDKNTSKIDQLKNNYNNSFNSNNENEIFQLQEKNERLHERIEDKIRDLQNKLVKYLTNKYDIIFISYFPIGEISKISNRKTNRILFSWNHYKFRNRLKSKSYINNNLVIEVSEHYTSKCCSNCKYYDPSPFKENRLFVCKQCGLIADRDENGSKNILFKYGKEFISLE